MDNRIQVGSTLYTPEEIAALDEKYGKGFLQRNPHYGAPGFYKNADGSCSYPGPLPKAMLPLKAADKLGDADAKDCC